MHVQILQLWKYWISLATSIFFIGQSFYFFIHPEDKFSVLLPSSIELIRVDSLQQETLSYQFGGTIPFDSTYFSMTFVVSSSKESNYMDSIMVSEFENKCHCRIKSVDKIEYSNFSGAKYFFEKENDNITIYGLATFSDIMNGSAFKSVVVMPLVQQEQSSYR